MRDCKSGAAGAASGLLPVLVLTCLIFWPVASYPAKADPSGPDFRLVYDILRQHCGACHVQGIADGPWSLNTAPSSDRFAQCLAEKGDAQLRCATYHELVDEPAAGIPAWIRPAEASLSEPYVQACDPSASFHIGHSLAAALPAEACTALLHWIESGAHR